MRIYFRKNAQLQQAWKNWIHLYSGILGDATRALRDKYRIKVIVKNGAVFVGEEEDLLRFIMDWS